MPRLKRYLVTGELTISVCTDVLAASPAQAKNLARQRGIMSLCHQCAGDDTITEEWVTSGDLDGEPRNIRIGP